MSCAGAWRAASSRQMKISPLFSPTAYDSTFGTYVFLRSCTLSFCARTLPTKTRDMSQSPSTFEAASAYAKRGTGRRVVFEMSMVAIVFSGCSKVPRCKAWAADFCRRMCDTAEEICGAHNDADRAFEHALNACESSWLQDQSFRASRVRCNSRVEFLR